MIGKRRFHLLLITLMAAGLLLLTGCASKDLSRNLSDVIPIPLGVSADDVADFELTTFGNSDRRVISGEIGGRCRVGYAQCFSDDGKEYSRHYYSFDESGKLESIEFGSLAGTKNESTECSHYQPLVDEIEKSFGKWDVVDKSGRSELYGNVNGVPCKVLYYPGLNIGFYRYTER